MPNSCSCGTIFDLAKKEKEAQTLEEKSSQPNFWNDTQKAGVVMRDLEGLKTEMSNFATIERSVRELGELSQLSELEESDIAGLQKDIDRLEKEVAALEFITLLSGPYDRSSVLLTVRAGAGGVDAQDWAEMLLRMYMRYAEKKNFLVKLLDESRGGEAGIKSATIEIRGLYAYGYLRGESGIHRLVRLSPFNSQSLRQTSFAAIDTLPVLEKDNNEIVLNTEDLRIDTYRSGGAGGQNVNKTESAARITHIPTGTVAACQSERSQLQNREEALKVLKSKLLKMRLEEQETERRELRGEQKSAEWGNQIRSYVLHPYTMVKDHRTGEETSNAGSVLDGALDSFIESTLQYMKKNQ